MTTTKPKVEENISIDKILQEKSVIEEVQIQTPDYNYGGSQEPLNGAFQVRNISSGGLKVKTGSFTITGTGNISITGVGFTPALVEFRVCDLSGGTGVVGIGSMTSNNQNCVNIANSANITSECIYYGNPVKARAVYVSMDVDGFTINCTYFTANSYVLYTAIG